MNAHNFMRMTKRALLKPTGVAEESAAFEPRKSMAQRQYERDNPAKRAVNLTASSYWLHEARQLNLNLSAIFGEALEKAVRNAIREELKREVAELAQWQAKDMEEHGLWNEEFRLF